jgi:hypothetical protein
VDLTPSLILSMWAAGIGAGAALVAWWAIVGPGYARLSGMVLVLAAAAAAAAGAGVRGWVAVGCALAATVLARHKAATVVLFSAAALLLAAAAVTDSPVLPAVTGLLVLGGITAEMMLGHWYLVDPRLPRWALQSLVLGAAVALVVDAVYLMAEGALDWGAGDEVLGWAFLVFAAMTALLMAAVSFALREPFYTGVMAATGLSYLAVLTAFGSVVLGRLLAY